MTGISVTARSACGTYDQATQTFGTEKMLVGDASNNYYPSFSPDGECVLFNKLGR